MRNDDVRVENTAEAHPAPRQLLNHTGITDIRRADATVLLRHHELEQTEFAHPLHELIRERVVVLKLIDDGNDLAVYPAAYLRRDGVLRFDNGVRHNAFGRRRAL